MRRHALLAALLGAALLAGCGDDDDPAAPPAGAGTDTIRIAEFLYNPDPATVKADMKISVPNADDAPHTLTEEGGSPSFDSGTITGKATGSVTFTTPGTFTYYCEFHPTMKGTVTVLE